ncbi:MAG: hypothetical protein WC856_03085 [Methylococcaceae bacterium]|jgi:hypothetical protein
MSTVFSRVTGTVRTETGEPAINAIVQAFDKDMCKEQLLGEAVITETTGFYTINYTADQFLRAEKKTADLIVRAYFPRGTLRVESKTLFNAFDEARINLTLEHLPVTETPSRPEFVELINSIVRVRELLFEREHTIDITYFLVHETSREVNTGPQHYYFKQRMEALMIFTSRIPTKRFQCWMRLSYGASALYCGRLIFSTLVESQQ